MSQRVASLEDVQREPARVLVVDDDEVNLLLTCSALRERGFDVTEAGGGEQALALLQHRCPDVLVIDALMPGIDGFEVCRRLRAMNGFETLPVLMLTGLEDDASVVRSYDAGATDFFVKSAQWSLLAGRLRYLLRASRTRAELERNRAKLARAQDLARMGSFEWTHSGGLVLSIEALRVLGGAAARAGHAARVGLHTLMRMIPEGARQDFAGLLRDVLRHQTVLAADVAFTLGGTRERIVHVEAEPQFDERGHVIGYTGVVQDVTDRRIAEDRIRHLANFDALTGLPNRRQLIWRAEAALERAARARLQAALLLIDLDRFKVINDTLGHAAGDELLSEVARRLRGCVRHCDQVVEDGIETVASRQHRSLEAVGRLGGDEFVALLPELADEHDAERVARRMLDALRDPILVGGQECFVTASIGVAVYPRDGMTVADLLRNSDVAMYAAKSAGRNGIALYSPQLAGRGREKLELESALHKALERGELVLHYQPKVDVRSGSMVGVEALMRWQRGGVLVPPGDFIPLAEETGLIVPMSEWAVREAARQAMAWRESFGFADAIAVNLPTRLFERSDLVERIHEAVMEHGVSHRAIQLEITETGLMKDLQSVIPSLHRLNGVGVEIAVDDFGTGYSSLSYLTMLPISELKIDRSFVRDLGITPQSLAVVTAIVALAQSLRLRVIAEGVETLRQMAELERLGCSLMQGFLFSKPLPADELPRWVDAVLLPRKAAWFERPASSGAAVVVPLRAGQRG